MLTALTDTKSGISADLHSVSLEKSTGASSSRATSAHPEPSSLNLGEASSPKEDDSEPEHQHHQALQRRVYHGCTFMHIPCACTLAAIQAFREGSRKPRPTEE